VKKFLILVAVAAIFLATGCAGRDKPYTNPAQTINIGVNQEFVITLASNPTTGYGWQASYDETMVELTESKYKIPEMEKHERVKQGIVGGGGIEYFRFQALKAGKTEITLVYKRLWEEESLYQAVYTVTIK
jgi:inhibitor of cysteine peptidase